MEPTLTIDGKKVAEGAAVNLKMLDGMIIKGHIKASRSRDIDDSDIWFFCHDCPTRLHGAQPSDKDLLGHAYSWAFTHTNTLFHLYVPCGKPRDQR